MLPPSTQQPNLLVASSCIKSLGQGERKKYGPECGRTRRKVHLGIGAETLEIPAQKVTRDAIDEAPMPVGVLAQILIN